MRPLQLFPVGASPSAVPAMPAWHLCGFWNPNSSPQACSVRTLIAEPSSQPISQDFLLRSMFYLWACVHSWFEPFNFSFGAVLTFSHKVLPDFSQLDTQIIWSVSNAGASCPSREIFWKHSRRGWSRRPDFWSRIMMWSSTVFVRIVRTEIREKINKQHFLKRMQWWDRMPRAGESSTRQKDPGKKDATTDKQHLSF